MEFDWHSWQTDDPFCIFYPYFHAKLVISAACSWYWSCCYVWEKIWNKHLQFSFIFYIRKDFTFDPKDFRQCLFYFLQFLMPTAIFNRLLSPSCSPIILYNFWSTCTAEIQCNSFALILPVFLEKYKFWFCFTLYSADLCSWSLHLTMAESSHFMLLGILDVTSQNSPQWNLYFDLPLSTEVFIYKIYKEVVCMFSNISFCLWRLCSYGIQKWFSFVSCVW